MSDVTDELPKSEHMEGVGLEPSYLEVSSLVCFDTIQPVEGERFPREFSAQMQLFAAICSRFAKLVPKAGAKPVKLIRDRGLLFDTLQYQFPHWLAAVGMGIGK